MRLVCEWKGTLMQSRAEESFYRSARAWARRQAARCGLNGDLAEELEQGFVVKWLLKPMEPPIWTWPAGRREPFLRRAAWNYALNFVHGLQAESASLAAYAIRLCDDDATLPEIDAVQPEKRLFRSLFWRQIESGMQSLRPGAGELIAGYLCGDTSGEIGCASGRTKHAVNQGLSHARRRLRAILMSQGNTETELRSYVSLMRPMRVPGKRPLIDRGGGRLPDINCGDGQTTAPLDQ